MVQLEEEACKVISARTKWENVKSIKFINIDYIIVSIIVIFCFINKELMLFALWRKYIFYKFIEVYTLLGLFRERVINRLSALSYATGNGRF